MPILPARAIIREVGLRDGLQSIQTILPTARKIEWIRDAYEAGQRGDALRCDAWRDRRLPACARCERQRGQ